MAEPGLYSELESEDAAAAARRELGAAAKSGDLDLVKKLRGDGGVRGDETTCAAAAEGGHLKVLKWLRAEGCPWDWRTCNGAVRCGSVLGEAKALEVLQWARENGCEWNSDAVLYAVERGLLEVLKYLKANDCPWHWRMVDEAVSKGHMEVLRWARENGHSWSLYAKKKAKATLGYTDDYGNLATRSDDEFSADDLDHSEEEDDKYSDEDYSEE